MSPTIFVVLGVLGMFLAATGRLQDVLDAIQGKGPSAKK